MSDRTQPLLGTTDRKTALAGFKEIRLEVSQDPFGYYAKSDTLRAHTYSEASLPRGERCLNPRCQQGGLDLQMIVEFWPDGTEKTFPCGGHEGTLKGRVKGQSCDNSFKISLHVVRENETE